MHKLRELTPLTASYENLPQRKENETKEDIEIVADAASVQENFCFAVNLIMIIGTDGA